MISEGCEQCAKGGKMVLFVYGYCDQRDCFYCPLGENRKNVTQVYANERPVESDADVLEEAHRMEALGTSITGGEPQEIEVPSALMRLASRITSSSDSTFRSLAYTSVTFFRFSPRGQ